MNKTDRWTHLDERSVVKILDSIADGVFTVDRDFIVTSFNRAAERITGFTSDEAIGQKCFNIFRGSVCQTGCLLSESMRTGREITGLELTVLNRRNEEIPISVSTAVLLDDKGAIVGGVETFRDLTAVEGLRREIRRRFTFHDLVSKSHQMQELFAIVPDIAASTASVLIEGETGTGKELLARAIHNESPRNEQPFVKVNCAALPDALLESELFGHVAGAFTDARHARLGRFATADGGTIFLDEIGDMSPAMQVKLLRVLQEGAFEPLGSSETQSVNVRVISATHHCLKDLVGKGGFRQDLYYRINTVHLDLPALRRRREDVPPLVEHFIERFNTLTGKEIRAVSGEAMQVMMAYSWPGNIREMEHAIEYAFVVCKGPVIDGVHLPLELRTAPSVLEPPPVSGQSPLAASERQAIEAALSRHNWNKLATAKALGISRTTLWRKMQRLSIA